MRRNKKIFRIGLVLSILMASLLICQNFAYAAVPSGTNWFQLLASPFTGSDNTGDGGTGFAGDLNYYYVGQTFTTNIQISADHSNAANIWIDFDSASITPSNLLTGNFYSAWAGQTISGGRLKSTGYRVSGYSAGVGDFGSVQWTMIKPAIAAYGTTSPALLDINIGTVGLTTESNISEDGTDRLQDAEDFRFHLWADTKKPYAKNPSPADGAVAIAAESNFTFELRDTKNGEGDDTGVGTGVNTTEPPGAITVNDGGGPLDYTAYDSFACSGIWGSNLCNTTVNPPSPLSIPGDTRNWEYSTTYTVIVSAFRDFASATQNQLGDANGPNTMDAKTWTFTTEADTVAPRVVAETPARGSANNSVSTNITFDIVDKKTYPGTVSGSGVNSPTCRINISSATFPLTTYIQSMPGVSVVAIDYGYRFTIDPASNFGQNETVSVSVYDCQDAATVPNTMVTDNWTFSTGDTDPPYVDTIIPADDAVIAKDGTVSFHIKDNGTVDLSNTVIYVNGTYYTNTGGAGVVTTNGTRITFASSLNFNGGNYAGDTTNAIGAPNDYTFTLDPQTDFVDGEAVPVIIYSRDIAGNIMERVVYSNVVMGAGCVAGSTYCGGNTSWDGALLKCVGTGTGTGTCAPAPSGSTAPILLINQPNANVIQIDSTSVLVTWFSSVAGSGRVIYDTVSPSDYGTSPNYNYRYSTTEYQDNSVYHSVVVDGLQAGKLYYFRPVTKAGGNEVRGDELLMAPKFDTQYIEKTCPVISTKQTTPSPTTPSTGGTTGGYRPPTTGQTAGAAGGYTPPTTETAGGQTGGATAGTSAGTSGGATGLLKILDIRQILSSSAFEGRGYTVSGQAASSISIKAVIY